MSVITGDKSRIKNIWSGMVNRCNNANNPAFCNYGGRGISVCDEWESNFEAFYEWAMANGYEHELTIERKNNDGNYEPSNCKWATRKEQAKDKRHTPKGQGSSNEYTKKTEKKHTSKRINLKVFRVGKQLTQSEIAETLGVSTAFYSSIENGKRNGRLDFWVKFQDVFGLDDAVMWSLQKLEK